MYIASPMRSPLMDNHTPVTHWGRNKMADIFQTAFSKAFSSMKIIVFWFKFHCKLFPRVPSIYLLLDAPLGLNELTHWDRVTHICVGKLTDISSANEPMLEYCLLDPWEQTSMKSW